MTFPGTFPVANFAGVAPLTSITQVLSAANSGEADGEVVVPNGVLAGDLMVCFNYAPARKGTPIPDVVIPSGFTQIADVNNSGTFNDSRALVSIKLAAGDEDSTTLVGMNEADLPQSHMMLYIFRGNRPFTGAIPFDIATEMNNSGNPAAQVVNVAGIPSPLIIFGCYGTFLSVVNPRTFSTTKDGEINSPNFDSDAWLAYKIYNSSPADSTIDMDDEDALNTLISFGITLE